MRVLNTNYDLQYLQVGETPLKVDSLVHIQSNDWPEWVFSLHSHDTIEMSLILSGQGIVHYKGKAYEVNAGDLVVKFANVPHSEENNPNFPLEQLCMTLSEDEDHFAIFDSMSKDRESPILKTGHYFPFFKQIFLHIAEIYEKMPKDYELIIHNNLKALFSSLSLIMPDNDTLQKQVTKEGVMKDVIDYIDKNYTKNITLNDLANLFYFSPSYLSRTFKEETGFTINQYIVGRRMGDAQMMLIMERDSIKDIAAKTGYSNLQYFYTTFKKHTGYTPAEFKRKYLLKGEI